MYIQRVLIVGDHPRGVYMLIWQIAPDSFNSNRNVIMVDLEVSEFEFNA